MKKILAILLILSTIFTLCACTLPAVSNPDGSDTLAGTTLKTGLDIVEALALALISIAGAAWTTKSKNKTYLQNINIAMARVIEMTKITVGELKQTIVDELKGKSVDGKLTPEQIKELKCLLLAKTLEKLDDPTKDLLSAAGADICALITGAGEDWVGALKTENGLLIGEEIKVEAEKE